MLVYMEGNSSNCQTLTKHIIDPSSTGPQQDSNTVRVIGDVLDYDTPDLVVLNGDLISGELTYAENSTHYVDQIVAPIVERNLTWASTYGNHDHNYNITGEGILEREQLFSGSRTKSMVNETKAGTTNYYLPVYPSNCTSSTASNCTPELLLWFFDSRGGFYWQGEDQENWVDESVATWFNETNTELVETYDKVIPSLAFVHIPPNATMALQDQLGINKNYQPGIDADPLMAQQGEGWCANGTRDEDNCHYGAQDEPFMNALVSIEGVMALFYGHDHGNTWCYRWDEKLAGMSMEGNGIHLCYGQHSGYGGYGDWIRGAREIVVSLDQLKDRVVETYMRLESGDVVGSVTLNETFNDDWYPATPDTKTYMTSNSDDDTGSDTTSMGSSGRSVGWEGVGVSVGWVLMAIVWLCV